MYVCICNAVTESQIRTLVEQGVDDLHTLQQITGCAATCGSCLELAEQALNRARRGHPMHFEMPVFRNRHQLA